MHYLCEMQRIVAIDYGSKRCGLAISDPLNIIANGLETVDTDTLLVRLYNIRHELGFQTVVVGLPRRLSGEMSAIETDIRKTIETIKIAFPDVKIVRMDERFTSKIAMQTLVSAGAKKSQRREKGTIDKVSATLLLQEYLNLM